MICRNCGNELMPDASFCVGCGARVELQQQMVPVQASKPASKNPVMLPLIIACSVVGLVLVVCVTLILVSMFGGSLSVDVNSYPSTTESNTIVLSGIVSSKNSNAALSVNGEFVGNVMANTKGQPWSKTVQLKSGTNTFLVTVTDAKGNTDTETVRVICNSNVVFAKGTVLVKYNTSGVYVRPTPQISNKYVLLIDRNDYTSQFVCLGEESRDAEGYIWCKVQTPRNGIGWVRSDLMRVLK